MRCGIMQRSNRMHVYRLLCGAALLAMAANTLAPFAAAAAEGGSNDGSTTTPIKHVIVIIGENRTFDHIFATYQPKNQGEKVWNLLSEGIVNEDGSPGRNYYRAALQKSAADEHQYSLSPGDQMAYKTLPPPLVGGPTNPPFASLSAAMAAEDGLAPDYYKFLTTGGTGLKSGALDTRISYDGQPVTSLPPGPFQLTPGVPYDAYAASPVHRFYQMWQQIDCRANASCRADLFPWVEATVGAGSNGKAQPAGFTYAEGATSMGFYNVQQGDAPYFEYLADHYSMSDNYHQAVNGGTGANHIMLGTGDAIWFSDADGNPAAPPHNQVVAAGSANEGTVDEIENPNAQPGTNNYYVEDGYGGGSFGSPSYGGGSYSECANISQPGVAPIVKYLRSLSRPVKPNCQPGHYYLLNNYNPGYFGDGTNAYADIGNPKNTVFTVPPSTLKNIGDELLTKNISFAYFGDQFDLYLKDRYDQNSLDAYCNICNFLQYSTSIMTNAAVRTAHLKDTLDLYADIQNGNLPAISFVKPSGFVDGHPSSSKLDLFEGFVKKIVDLVQANPSLWASTAIMITTDEGGGYYDSGYIQPLDFFGDGTRVPMLVVSPYSLGGRLSHVYSDHVSVLKFIEANWGLPPLTNRSRDNLPDPKTGAGNPYVPVNSPAIGDLMDLFRFPHRGKS